MIKLATQPSARRTASGWHAGFLAMLPAIRRNAQIAFRGLSGEAREDAIQEVVANALVAYVRLVELGKVELAYPSVLARYAVAQIRVGRRVGTRANSKDVLSRSAQLMGIVVERLDKRDKNTGQWKEAVVQDTHNASVPDIVAFRIDFVDWLQRHSNRNRRIAEALAVGHTTADVARRFRLSPGRISQLRRELHESWQEFQGEATPPTCAAQST